MLGLTQTGRAAAAARAPKRAGEAEPGRSGLLPTAMAAASSLPGSGSGGAAR